MNVRAEDPTKLGEMVRDPYLINHIFTNGTVELQLNAENSTTVIIRILIPIRNQNPDQLYRTINASLTHWEDSVAMWVSGLVNQA